MKTIACLPAHTVAAPAVAWLLLAGSWAGLGGPYALALAGACSGP